jgi:hypothetical protein
MICAEFVDGAASAPVVSAAASQPADVQTCAVVLLTGTDTTALSGFAFPAAVDMGQAWMVGFSLVVASYVMGWGVGVLLNMFRNR